jgi:hypothetical protein
LLCQIVILNPALSVGAERFTMVEDKTPEITIEQANLRLRHFGWMMELISVKLSTW